MRMPTRSAESIIGCGASGLDLRKGLLVQQGVTRPVPADCGGIQSRGSCGDACEAPGRDGISVRPSPAQGRRPVAPGRPWPCPVAAAVFARAPSTPGRDQRRDRPKRPPPTLRDRTTHRNKSHSDPSTSLFPQRFVRVSGFRGSLGTGRPRGPGSDRPRRRRPPSELRVGSRQPPAHREPRRHRSHHRATPPTRHSPGAAEAADCISLHTSLRLLA